MLVLTSTPAFADKALQPVRGVVRAEVAATISTELVARIKQLPFKTGQSFSVGDKLAVLDCRRYEADLRAAEAEASASKVTADQNRQLLRHRAGGANDLAIAEAKLAQARAVAESLKVRISQCVIHAPFNGRVSDRFVDVFESPQSNSPLLSIVKDGNLEIDLIVPSNWATWLRPGHDFSFEIDETETVHSAKVLFLGAIVDPISRTMKVSAQLVDHTLAVRPGMSGSAFFETPKS